MVNFIAGLIDILVRGLVLMLIAYVFISYFLDPYHPFRRNVSRLVDPFLAPIRRLIPPIGMIDFSPIILLIIIQIIGRMLTLLIQELF